MRTGKPPLLAGDLITPNEAGDMVGVSGRTIRRLFHEGEIRGVQFARAIRVSRSDIIRKYDLTVPESSTR